ncbi:MAG TPA: hypothetical protein VFO93_09410 [Hymenobacter sp.]|uniref:hypothetical protein n=1 Tax=Hymenobacter sp. TaxID=1898978 RepID=UPI002D80FA01|nr:hypothetical protein [Hymenobacter sp.]HET9503748.1 hypothetical protein [Hymenobacter sp.]
MALTSEQVKQVYQVAKKIYEGSVSAVDGVECMFQQHAMNKGTARIFISVFPKLREGQLYKYGLAGMPMDYFLTRVLIDYGKAGLLNALNAFKSHIEYYEDRRKTNMNLLREIYKKHLGFL